MNVTNHDLPTPLEVPSTLHHRLHRKKYIAKSLKDKIDANRTLTERLADSLTIHFGSMLFFAFNALCFSCWIVVNTGYIPGLIPFDPFPFGLLTMIVSLEAIFLAIVVLITQNRTAKIDDLREEITLKIDAIAEEEITKMIQLQIMILKKQGIDVSKDPQLQQMIEPMDTDKLEKLLEKQII